MATAQKDRLLGMLPARVRAYRAAVADGDIAAEERGRIEVCSVLEHLLGEHLLGCRGWEPGAWVDGVFPGTFDVSESGVASVAGLAVWSGSRGWFLDPFTARVELSADGAAVRTYSLRFGDAEAGLGKFPYKPGSKDRFRPPPREWCFVFGEAADPGAAPDRGVR